MKFVIEGTAEPIFTVKADIGPGGSARLIVTSPGGGENVIVLVGTDGLVKLQRANIAHAGLKVQGE